MIKAVGAGGYGSVSGATGSASTGKAAAGNSKLFPAKSTSALNAVARSHTQQFISNAKQVAQGASGASRINIKV
jgi:hypothetical protein